MRLGRVSVRLANLLAALITGMDHPGLGFIEFHVAIEVLVNRLQRSRRCAHSPLCGNLHGHTGFTH